TKARFDILLLVSHGHDDRNLRKLVCLGSCARLTLASACRAHALIHSLCSAPPHASIDFGQLDPARNPASTTDAHRVSSVSSADGLGSPRRPYRRSPNA